MHTDHMELFPFRQRILAGSWPASPGFGSCPILNLQSTVRAETGDPPNAAVPGMPDPIGPEQTLEIRKTPASVASDIHTVIKGQHDLTSPPPGISSSLTRQMMQ